MSTVYSAFQRSELAEAAYADFSDPTVTVEQALQNKGFSEAQAAETVANWRVVDHLPDGVQPGFSATILENLAESIAESIGSGEHRVRLGILHKDVG